MKKQKIWAWIFLPIAFFLIGYLILFLLAQPYIRPMTSIYDMISQNQTPDFSSTAKNLYTEKDGLPTNGKLNALDIKSIRVGDTMGQVIIDDVNIDVPLLYGSTDECLYVGAGLRTQSHKPGYGKPVMIAGHTIPYFKNLGLVKEGQIVTVKTYYGIFKYKITGTKVANEEDSSAYDLDQKKEQLILFTCYPLDGIGNKTNRLFVYADKMSGPEVVGDIK
jgi:sortase A